MEQKRGKSKSLILGAAVLLAVTAAALALTGVLQRQSVQQPAYAGGYPVHISEIMTYNTVSPNEEGLLCDWVELVNTTDTDFELGGYLLSDEAGKGKYTFPAGTVVPAGGRLVVWCDSTAESETYAPFALKRDGGETVYLMTSNSLVLDSVQTLPADKNQSQTRRSDGGLDLCDTPTPGFANTAEGYAQWEAYMAGRSGGTFVISELMTSNSLYANPDGVYCDWVEIHNPTDYALSLEKYRLTDREGEAKYEFPADVTVPAGGYAVVWCSGDYEGPFYAPFGLNRDGGETLYLINPGNTEADSVTVPVLESNESWALAADGSWAVSAEATPGFANTAAGYEAYCVANGAGDVSVAITEVASRNNGILPDADGDYSDWIELTNTGGEPVELGGWYLSDKAEEPNRWKLPALTLQPGEARVIFASGKNRTDGELHTDFALSDGEKVTLATPGGLVFAEAQLEILTDGRSLALQPDGAWRETAYPTPGQQNDADGYVAFCESRAAAGPLVIEEVMASNAAVNPQPDVGSSDWVEIRNISDGPVELSDYALSDTKQDTALWPLPSGVLAPGESVIYYCSGNEKYTADGFTHTNFALSSGGEALYLWKNGKAVDGVYLHSIPSGGSMGRMDGENGFFYFTKPTPGGKNTGGVRMVASTPAADVPAGVYEGVENVTVTLTGDGEIRYTTDGSIPTEDSKLYTQPLVLTETGVIRARCFAEGMLDGRTVTLTYIINEGHTLPVASLVADEDSLFGYQGIYSSHEQAWLYDWEREANLSFFEETGSFSLDCGVQIHGQTSRRASEKRSMKVMFRGSYAGDLNYDVFGDGEVTEFSSLILRGSLEDNYTSYMRDEIFAELAMSGTEVIAQNYRYVVLYINGEYWGIYSIREHLSDNYFATHYGVDKDTVDRQNGTYRRPGPWSDLMGYCQNNNMNDAANYAYLQERLDIDEMIEWLILQCYSGNIDVYGNVRFYASPDYNGGRYMYGLVDMDLAMMGHNTYTVGFDPTGQLHGIIPCSLRNNAQFRDAFLTRLGQMLAEDLTEENVNSIIDSITDTIEDEIPRDLKRWYQPENRFAIQTRNLKDFTAIRVGEMVGGAQMYCGLTAAEMDKYFADVEY